MDNFTFIKSMSELFDLMIGKRTINIVVKII